MKNYTVRLDAPGIMATSNNVSGTLSWTMEIEAKDEDVAIELAGIFYEEAMASGSSWDWLNATATATATDDATDDATDRTRPYISKDDMRRLLASITLEDIAQAMADMGPRKV